MLKLVHIENIILIHSAQISFESGLNILTGETGAGKSAVMQALMLVAGLKADPKLIRHGSSKGIVEALFELPETSHVWGLLAEAGLSYDPAEPLIIRRELSLTGKSRGFVNHQMAGLPLIKDLGDSLFDIASQHASLKLVSESFQRKALDSFGGLDQEAYIFSKNWEEETKLAKQLDALIKGESIRLRETEVCRFEIDEIDEAKLKNGEDEILFQEYTDLATSEERYATVETTLSTLSGNTYGHVKSQLEHLVRLDETAQPILELFTQAKIELDEVVYQLNRKLSTISFHPEKMEIINERLKLITRLKKKYGSTVEEILAWKEQQTAKLLHLATADTTIEHLEIAVSELKQKNQELAEQLSLHRREAALRLQAEMTRELREMNMPKAEFFIELSLSLCSRHGQDHVDYLFYPNLGGKKVSVKEGASGGELARILLALKTILAEKEGEATLIFDEVDANIGGETAKMLGQKLAKLGKNTQVIAITHFPQVAAEADHHLRVRKMEKEGTTCSFVETISSEEREKELSRMVGIT